MKKTTILIVVAVAVGLAIGGYFIFKGKGGGKTKIFPQAQITYNQSKGEAVTSLDLIASESKIIYSERKVISIDENGENQYQTDFYLSDLKGEKKYKFYEAKDLTYEQAYPYLSDQIIILTEFGQQENRIIGFKDGLVKDAFNPPIAFGTDFVVSNDNKYLAYVETTGETENTDEEISYVIKIRNLETKNEQTFDPRQIKHGEIEFNQHLMLGFSQDNNYLFLAASLSDNDTSTIAPNGLYRLSVDGLELKEIYFSSPETTAEKDIILLLGVYPEQGFALVNRGPIIGNEDKTIMRTQLQGMDLETSETSDIYTDNDVDRVGSSGKILSPDGKKIVLYQEAYYDKGLLLYDIETKTAKKLTDRGDFLAWANDAKTFIYRVSNYGEETSAENQSLEFHALNVETGEDYKLFTQTVFDEGTGLNKVGDLFYGFIGLN